MYLISIFAALWADHRFPDYLDLRCFSLYRFFTKTFITMGIGNITAWLPFVIVTVVPALIIKMAISILGFVFVIEIVLWVAVLYVCLPPDPIAKLVDRYLAANRENDARAIDTIADSLLDASPPKNSSERNQQISHAVLSEKNLHIVAVFFWFALLGIGAAVFYKLNWVLHTCRDPKIRNHESIQAHVKIALGLMSWIPARFLMLAYGLVGSFTPIFKILFMKRATSENRLQGSIRLLTDAGIAALRLDSGGQYTHEHVNQSWRLVRRANIALLIFCSALEIFKFFIWF